LLPLQSRPGSFDLVTALSDIHQIESWDLENNCQSIDPFLSTRSFSLSPTFINILLLIGTREGWSAEQLEISATSLGLSQRIGLAMRESWEAHSNELTSSLLSKIISANQLVDVDWSFGVTASTEDCDKVLDPLFSADSSSISSSLLLVRLEEHFSK
jgi:hypothetical protein